MKNKSIIKVVAFLLIFCICFFQVQGVLTGNEDSRDYRRITGFFEERDDSLDAVFVGSSTTYAFWSAPYAWYEHGLAVYSLSSIMQPIQAARFLIADARKRHPDAVFIVNITSVHPEGSKHSEYDLRFLHGLLDNYPLTLNKYRMMDYLCDLGGHGLTERMELVFPIIKYHSRWNELTAFDFDKKPDSYKTGNTYGSFLKNTEDVTGGIKDFSLRSELETGLRQSVEKLMDYCEKKKVKVLFVVSPQSLDNEERIGMQNTLVEMIEERNFDVLDFRKLDTQAGIDYSTDFYDTEHTNIHGSIKFTDYISRYLKEKYGLENKRDNEEYSDWEKASVNYFKKIAKHLGESDMKYFIDPIEIPEK